MRHRGEVLDFHRQVVGDGPGATAVAYIETRVGGDGTAGKTRWGVGRDPSPVAASLKAVVSAVNRS
jgi:2-isopropylmalate synthase